jgi:hypothetical protein
MRTLLVDVERLGVVMLRETPRRLERDGNPVATADGEVIFLGRLIVPGGARTPWAAAPSPLEVRLKTLGSDRGLRPGPVRLGGRVSLTAWYQRGGRGSDAKSELTVSAQEITPAPGGQVQLAGWLPVRLMTPNPSDPLLLLDQVPIDGGFRTYLMTPEGAVEGLAEVTSTVSVTHLVGKYVTVDLTAKLVVPDREDVGRSTKSELPLAGTNWQAVDEPKPARRERPAEAPAEAVAS